MATRHDTSKILIRLTPVEHSSAKAMAEGLGLSLNEFCRRRLVPRAGDHSDAVFLECIRAGCGFNDATRASQLDDEAQQVLLLVMRQMKGNAR